VKKHPTFIILSISIILVKYTYVSLPTKSTILARASIVLASVGHYQEDRYRYGEPYKEVIKKIDEQYPHITIYEKQKLEKEIAIERIKRWFSVNPKQFIESYTIKKAKIQWETPFYWIGNIRRKENHRDFLT
jgi:hypothetical protein